MPEKNVTASYHAQHGKSESFNPGGPREWVVVEETWEGSQILDARTVSRHGNDAEAARKRATELNAR